LLGCGKQILSVFLSVLQGNFRMTTIGQIRNILHGMAANSGSRPTQFFKTGIGDYAEHDKFIGVSVPALRKIAQDFANLTIDEIRTLLMSGINEERLLALIILVKKYQRASDEQKTILYQCYLQNLQKINNWNLVDSSAHFIMGDYLYKKDRSILIELAASHNVWNRRIAIITTWYFVRNNDFAWTIKIAKILLHDNHDLIHKAVGWMLREVGKKNQLVLVAFLDEDALYMPRTMLRYAIEKLSDPLRKQYLLIKSNNSSTH
jgi:3-methyladenine DNA glycosylase AlkD